MNFVSQRDNAVEEPVSEWKQRMIDAHDQIEIDEKHILGLENAARANRLKDKIEMITGAKVEIIDYKVVLEDVTFVHLDSTGNSAGIEYQCAVCGLVHTRDIFNAGDIGLYLKDPEAFFKEICHGHS